MTRLRRIVVPHAAHHVTQRGNRREPIFFEDGDQEIYCDLLAQQCTRWHVDGKQDTVPGPATPRGITDRGFSIMSP